MASFTPPQNLKQRVFACLTKLSDRDTHNMAANELQSIAKTLEPSSFPIFISCIHSTDSADKAPVRRQCVSLLATLSETHRSSLSPYLSKMISGIIRRLRDQDSAVRSACAKSTAAISSYVTKPPFSHLLKPLLDALFTEQDHNAQIGAAMCLAAAVDATPDPEPGKLVKLMPRFEKLLKCDGFRAKPALLTLIGSVVETGAVAGNEGILKNLVPDLVGFLRSEDWAARKAAAEALAKLAVLERDMLAEFKTGCIKTFENRRFDKVKAVREIMNQALEAWKQVPDLSDEASPPPRSQVSSREDASDGRYPPSKFSARDSSATPQVRKRVTGAARSSPLDGSVQTTARKRSLLKFSDKNVGPTICGKIDYKKPLNWKVDAKSPKTPQLRGDDLTEGDENAPDRSNFEKNMFRRPETAKTLFGKNSIDKMHKVGAFKSGSRVVPCGDENLGSAGVAGNGSENVHRNHKDCEDISLIRKQLVQIEKQQSNLMDVLQKFIGSSENGMRALETRVHGLELALDDISYDLAVSSVRMTNSSRLGCCFMPRAEFLSPKFWRKSETRYPTSRYATSSGNLTASAVRYRAKQNVSTGPKLDNRRFRLNGGSGFIVNPLAEIQSDSGVHSGVANF